MNKAYLYQDLYRYRTTITRDPSRRSHTVEMASRSTSGRWRIAVSGEYKRTVSSKLKVIDAERRRQIAGLAYSLSTLSNACEGRQEARLQAVFP